MNPRISVVVATKNRGCLIKGMLQSLMHQEMEDWECIVVTDQCKDSTKAVLAGIADRRIRVFDNPRSGKAAALNFAKIKVKAPYVKFFDDDDFLLPNALERYIQMMEDTKADMAYSSWYILLMNNQIAYHPTRAFTLDDYLQRPMLGHGSLIITRGLYDRVEHNPEYPAAIDFDFICKCAMEGSKVAWTKKPLYMYRNHPTSITFGTNAVQRAFYEKTRDAVLEQLKTKKVTNECVEWITSNKE